MHPLGQEKIVFDKYSINWLQHRMKMGLWNIHLKLWKMVCVN